MEQWYYLVANISFINKKKKILPSSFIVQCESLEGKCRLHLHCPQRKSGSVHSNVKECKKKDFFLHSLATFRKYLRNFLTNTQHSTSKTRTKSYENAVDAIVRGKFGAIFGLAVLCTKGYLTLNSPSPMTKHCQSTANHVQLRVRLKIRSNV